MINCGGAARAAPGFPGDGPQGLTRNLTASFSNCRGAARAPGYPGALPDGQVSVHITLTLTPEHVDLFQVCGVGSAVLTG